MKQSVSLIFDIGKTTKKALLFDEYFHVLEEQTEHFKEISDDDGFPAEDLQAVTRWVKDIFNVYVQHDKYEVSHVNFSAYGASFVHVDAKEKIIEPFYNYLRPLPNTCKLEFISQYDKTGEISVETASPFLGLLNSGLQLFWLKREKDFFSRIHTSLHFPQYFPFLLSGKKFTDITSIGCHTMLWDFQKQNYHAWVKQENLNALFPPIHTAGHWFPLKINGKLIRMGIGVHDSSAALTPYLLTEQEPFLLLSTGTWNICFNPFNNSPLTREELAKDCLCYLTHNGEPVKASRIFLGHEHEVQQRALADYFKVDLDLYKSVSFSEKIYQRLTSENSSSKKFFPRGMEGTGPMPGGFLEKTNFAAFENFEEAQHQLIRSLVQWQKISIDLVDPTAVIKNIIVVGGFTKSPLFLEVMKRELSNRNILVSDHPRASALGAAWLVNKDITPSASGIIKLAQFY